jgi:hypothetical protein
VLKEKRFQASVSKAIVGASDGFLRVMAQKNGDSNYSSLKDRENDGVLTLARPADH